MKPIFRWTIGATSNLGYECLNHSVNSLLKLYGNTFEYFILYNNSNVQILREIVANKPIALISQSWEDCPLPLEYKKNIGTSIWKFCPARFKINSHEIVCDNDLIITRKIQQIDDFLNSNNSVILVEDPIKYQGRFSKLFDNKNYNAGFVGLYPGFDLAKAMKSLWIENNSYETISQADEQGLTTATLKKEKIILISKKQFLLVHSQGGTAYSKYDEKTNKNEIGYYDIDFSKDQADAYHFVRLNASENHRHWSMFKNKKRQRLMM